MLSILPSAPSRFDALLPPRSRLFALPPLACQPSAVESLTSYLMRLAEAHCVPLGTLLVSAVAPLLAQPSLAAGTSRAMSSFLRAAFLLNSHGERAADWVQTLTTLTLRSDLARLTMMPWEQVISSRQLVHPHRRWCPRCYQAWSEQGHPLYEPLLWTISGVQVCPVHCCPLEETCPVCQQRSSWLAWYAHPGFCFECSSWLGHEDALQALEAEASAIQQAELIGTLLARTPEHMSVSQAHFIAALNSLVGQVSQGNRAAFARLIELPKTTLWELVTGRFPPSLAALLHLCQRFQISLVELLLGREEGRVVAPPSPLPVPSHKPGPRQAFPREHVRQLLQEVLADTTSAPLSMQAVAAQLGYPLRTINTHLPELCQAITRRYQAHRHARGIQRVEALGQKIRQAATELNKEGVPLTYHTVGARLGTPGCFREYAARAVLTQVLQELGQTTPGVLMSVG